MHPPEVFYVEHDGKVLLLTDEGIGPQQPQPGRLESDNVLRFPTKSELEGLDINVTEKTRMKIHWGCETYDVIKCHPHLHWPEHWAWKDDCLADNCVHPVVRESIYRSIHRLVSKVIIQNHNQHVLMGKIERGHFVGSWTLPGGYMDHAEHPSVGCVRETLEEFGINIQLNDAAPHITQQIFTEEGLSFVSFTYQSNWDGPLSELKLAEGEIGEAKWFPIEEAILHAASYFDITALKAIKLNVEL